MLSSCPMRIFLDAYSFILMAEPFERCKQPGSTPERGLLGLQMKSLVDHLAKAPRLPLKAFLKRVQGGEMTSLSLSTLLDQPMQIQLWGLKLHQRLLAAIISLLRGRQAHQGVIRKCTTLSILRWGHCAATSLLCSLSLG